MKLDNIHIIRKNDGIYYIIEEIDDEITETKEVSIVDLVNDYLNELLKKFNLIIFFVEDIEDDKYRIAEISKTDRKIDIDEVCEYTDLTTYSGGDDYKVLI